MTSTTISDPTPKPGTLNLQTYQVLHGKHSEKHPLLDGKGVQRRDDQGRLMWNIVKYVKGDVFQSRHDLVALFNHPGAEKFRLLDPNTRTTSDGRPNPAFSQQLHQPQPMQPVQPQKVGEQQLRDATKPLEQMTVKELQELAEAEEVDLKGAIKKEEIIKILRAGNVQ